MSMYLLALMTRGGISCLRAAVLRGHVGATRPPT